MSGFKLFSLSCDLPGRHIIFDQEFSIYGDLNNERTEIDSELAFGFLKMGVTLIYYFVEENG